MSSNVKSLSSILINGNEFRFLAEKYDDGRVHSPNYVYQCSGRLLFLASDVLADSTILASNYSRTHKRMAPLGYATRRKLKGFRVADLNSSGVLWFYSIQGLFRVVFEFCSIDTQKDCLEKLQTVWLSHYNDPPLFSVGELSWLQDDATNIYVTPSLTHTNETGDMKETHEAEEIIFADHTEATFIRRTSLKNSGTIHDSPRNPSVDYNIGSICPEMCSENMIKDRILDETASYKTCKRRRMETVDSEIEDERSACSDSNKDASENANSKIHVRLNRKSTGSENHRQYNNFKILLSIFLKEVSEIQDSSRLEDIIGYLMQVLNYLKFFATVSSELWQTSRIFFELMKDYLEVMQSDTEDGFPTAASFGLTREHCMLLNIVSDWLGQEFSGIQPQIEAKVLDFKRQNLYKIGSLPPVSHLIDSLFPSFMKKLVCNWIAGPKSENGGRSVKDKSEQFPGQVQPQSADDDVVAETAEDIDDSDTQVDCRKTSKYVKPGGCDAGDDDTQPECTRTVGIHTGRIVSLVKSNGPIQSNDEDMHGGKSGSDSVSDHSYMYDGTVAAHAANDRKLKQAQLVLELGTNCLVSGMAHVVYAQLTTLN